MPSSLVRAALLATATLAVAPASAQSAPAQAARAEATVLMPQDAAQAKQWENWGLADAVVHGDTIWLSGVIAWLQDGETDPQAAYIRAFERIGATLTRAGASWADVVEMTTYHTEITAQMPGFMAVKRRYVTAPFPAWTAIDVDRLTRERGVVEIKVVARRPSAATAMSPDGGASP